jgi:uncharacterized RDD family membrane protein YckC
MPDTPLPQPSDPDRYVIASATGVEVIVTLAGAGSRSYAFIIDWHIRTLLALLWFVCAAMIVSGHVILAGSGVKLSTAYEIAAALPATVIYFLYHPILEVVMRGRTPGKRMAGVRLIARSGGTPSSGALLIRNVFRMIDCMPGFYMVGLVATLGTREHLRIGDLAAGTLLVIDQERNVKSLAQLGTLAQHSRLVPAALDLVNDVLTRWDELDVDKRRTLATTLLMRLDAQAHELPPAALTEETVKTRLRALLNPGLAVP